MKTRLTALIAVLLCIISTAHAANDPVLRELKDWHVDLEPETIDSILKSSFETETGVISQQRLNQYLALMSSIWNAKMLITYLKLSNKLAERDKAQLSSQQAAWLKRREKEATEAGEGEKGGSAESAMYSEAFIKLTRERCADFQKLSFAFPPWRWPEEMRAAWQVPSNDDLVMDRVSALHGLMPLRFQPAPSLRF